MLAPRVVPHFDNHVLADRPMFMDNNARPHIARLVETFYGSSRSHSLMMEVFDYSACANVVSTR
jgi:truncated hemoglobin YjbI